MNWFKNNRKRFLGIFLALLFMMHYGSMNFFYHAHLVDGNVIVHSHPYKQDPNNKTPYQSHSHTAGAYLLLQIFNQTVWTCVSHYIPVQSCTVFAIKSETPYFSPFIVRNIFRFSVLRAPPAA
jgi:hypothetical protein